MKSEELVSLTVEARQLSHMRANGILSLILTPSLRLDFVTLQSPSFLLGGSAMTLRSILLTHILLGALASAARESA